MSFAENPSKAFRVFTWVVIFVAVLLVWWGAATTTKQAGMAFADWPLSLGSINPEGWLSHMIPFLEHSHRLIATLVGVLVLAAFTWVYARTWQRGLEVTALVVLLAVVFGMFIAAGAERFDADRKSVLLNQALLASLLPVAWLVWSWAKRGWHLLEKLCALALLMVTAQAIFGGLRVTEISDTLAVVHGCFGQAFFCVLILIAMAASPSWKTSGFRLRQENRGWMRTSGVVWVALISWQLIMGAKMRHFHRVGLADDGLFKTAGEWIPAFDNPVLAVMFLHKASAYFIFGFSLLLFAALLLVRSEKEVRRHVGLVVGLLVAQISLGLLVIGTGKNFWITNFHVLNGLAILAFVFVYAVRCCHTRPAVAQTRTGARPRHNGDHKSNTSRPALAAAVEASTR